MGRVSGAVVLAAGKGTRLPLGLPKVLTPIAGRPMVRYLLDTLEGFFRPPQITVVIGHRADEVRAALGENYRYVYQPEQLGTGDALAVCRPVLGPEAEVLVVGGDTPLVSAETLRRLLDLHAEKEAHLTFVSCVGGNPAGMGRVVRGPDGRVRRMVEERDAAPEELRIVEWNAGIYAISLGAVWDGLTSLPRARNGEYYLTDLVGWAVSQGLRVESLTVFDPDEVLGINTPADLLRAEASVFRRVRAKLMGQGVRLVGADAVWVEPSVRVAPGAVLLPLTYLGGETRVGTDCRIGPRTVLIDCEVGAGSAIRDVSLEGCRLEPGSRIPPDSGRPYSPPPGLLPV